MHTRPLFSSIFFICVLLHGVLPNSLDEELSLTLGQKMKLDQLNELIASRLPHEYMREELWLVEWLKVNKFDIPATEKKIMEHLKWREDNKMDTILDEDWSDYTDEYKLNVEGCDKDGRPLISTIIGDWDIRKEVLAGRASRIARYMNKNVEEANVMILQLQKAGHNVTQVVELYDFTNFNAATHICAQCFSIYIHNTKTIEENYPRSTHKSIMVNVPSAFSVIYNVVIRPFSSQESLDILSIHGKNGMNWKKMLRDEFGEENLSRQFGGLKEDVWSVDEIRKNISLFKCAQK